MPTQRENQFSKLVSVRLTHKMLADLKKLATLLDRPYQGVMKEAIEKGLPIVRDSAQFERKLRRDVKSYEAPNVADTIEKLRQAKDGPAPKASRKKGRRAHP